MRFYVGQSRTARARLKHVRELVSDLVGNVLPQHAQCLLRGVVLSDSQGGLQKLDEGCGSWTLAVCSGGGSVFRTSPWVGAPGGPSSTLPLTSAFHILSLLLPSCFCASTPVHSAILASHTLAKSALRSRPWRWYVGEKSSGSPGSAGSALVPRRHRATRVARVRDLSARVRLRFRTAPVRTGPWGALSESMGAPPPGPRFVAPPVVAPSACPCALSRESCSRARRAPPAADVERAVGEAGSAARRGDIARLLGVGGAGGAEAHLRFRNKFCTCLSTSPFGGPWPHRRPLHRDS